MQLDTSIPLQVRTPEPVDSLGALSRVMSFRQQQQEQQINQIKLQEVQQAQKFKGALANVLSQTPQANEDGVSVYDIPAITKALASQGFGADADQVVKHLGPINDAFRAERAAKLAVIKRGADGIIASGNDPELALHFLDQLDANKSYPKDQLDQYRAFIQANPRPETVAKITALISGPQKLATAAPGSTIYNTETGSTVSTVPDKADKPTEASLDADAQALLAKQAQGIALTPVEAANLKAYQTRKPPPQTSNEWKDVLLDGKPAKVFVDPKTWTVTDLSGKPIGDAINRIKPVPTATQVRIDNAGKPVAGDFAKEGDDFLTSVPIQWRKTVEKIAHYDEDPTKVASMRSGMRETLMQWVNQVNPSYDASQFTNRAPTRKAFTTGVQGQQINAINTAIGHIEQLTGVADKLGTGAFVPGNAAWNTVRTMFGSDKVTNFDTLKDALAGEVSSVLAKGGATVSGIADAKEKIKAANSPQQLAGYVKTLVPIMGSKLVSLDYQFHQAMGENDKFSALTPESKRILEKLGFDPAHPTIDASAPAPGAVPENVRDALKGIGAGRHTLSDGSVWMTDAAGHITKAN